MTERRPPEGDAAAEERPEAESTEVPGSVEQAVVSAAEEPSEAPSEPSDESSGQDRDADHGPVCVRVFGRTDVGLVREHNEDNFLVVGLDRDERYPPMEEVVSFELGSHGAIFAVCDGMGGANAGEVASQMAVDTIYEVMRGWDVPPDRDVFAHRMVRAIEQAGERIFSAAKMDPELRGMGTTATVAGLVDGFLFVGQVGDSRAYVLRGEQLGLVTKDQSLVNQLIEAGQLSEEDAESFELGNIILQALGTTESVNVDLSFVKLQRGDRLMLCSDGLSGLVHDEVIRDTLREVDDPKACCERLVEMANAGGGHDNITVVVVDFDGEGLVEHDPEARPVYAQYPLPVLEDPTPVHRGQPRTPSEKLAEERRGPSSATASQGLAGRGESDFGGSVPPARGSTGARWLALGALALLLLVVGLATMGGGSEERAGVSEPVAPSDDVVEPPSRDEARAGEVEVVIQVTEPDVELLVDDRSFGRTKEGEARLRLPPGVYRIAARRGQDVVAEQDVDVRGSGPLKVRLAAPQGLEPGQEAGAGDMGRAAEPGSAAEAGARPAAPPSEAPGSAGRAADGGTGGSEARQRQSVGTETGAGPRQRRAAGGGTARPDGGVRARRAQGARVSGGSPPAKAEQAEPSSGGSQRGELPSNPF